MLAFVVGVIIVVIFFFLLAFITGIAPTTAINGKVSSDKVTLMHVRSTQTNVSRRSSVWNDWPTGAYLSDCTTIIKGESPFG